MLTQNRRMAHPEELRHVKLWLKPHQRTVQEADFQRQDGPDCFSIEDEGSAWDTLRNYARRVGWNNDATACWHNTGALVQQDQLTQGPPNIVLEIDLLQGGPLKLFLVQ